jgi:hypothetical protein
MKKLIILLLPVLLILSCKKDKDPSCKTDAASIAGPYKVTGVTYKPDASSPETDYYNILFPDACDRDDILTFNINGTYLLKDAGVVCSPSNDDNGTWALSGTTMQIDGDPSTVESFNCKTLVLSNTDIQTGEKLKITLARQ